MEPKFLALEPKETKELIGFILSTANALTSALEDGKIDIKDALKFLAPLRKIKGAFEGIGKIPEEAKAMDQAQIRELAEYFAQEFDLPNDQIEAMIETSVEVGLNLLVLILGFSKPKVVA